MARRRARPVKSGAAAGALQASMGGFPSPSPSVAESARSVDSLSRAITSMAKGNSGTVIADEAGSSERSSSPETSFQRKPGAKAAVGLSASSRLRTSSGGRDPRWSQPDER